MQRRRPDRPLLLALSILVLLGCGGLAPITPGGTTRPAPVPIAGTSLWQCPTPLPVAQTAISLDPLGTPTVITDTLPTATPYYRGDSFFLGQDVYAGPLRLTVWGIERAGPAATPNGGIVQLVNLELAATTALPLDLAAQVVIREVRLPDGTGPRGAWRADTTTQQPYGVLPLELQPGQTWRGTVAIRTPEGTPTLLYVYRTPADARVASAVTDGLVIIRLTADPHCTTNIARQPLGPGGLPPGGPPGPIDRTPIAVPPGQNALVAFAVAHVGYPYVWGAKGPTAFDCSGLVYAAYHSIGIAIPAGTRGGPAPGQGFYGTAINVSELRPGDVLLFATVPGDQPTHAALYVGDLNGDGKGDLIEAASPALGVIFTSAWLDRPFYRNAFWGARRMPGFPY